MFRFADMGRVWVPVDLPPQAGPEDTAAEPARIHLLMDLYTDEELDQRDRDVMLRSGAALAEKARASANVEDLSGVLDDMQRVKAGDRADILRRTHDWHGIEGADGAPVAFSAEHLEALLAMAYLFKAVRAALFDASREGVRKN